MDIQAVHQLAPVGFHSLDAEIELAGNVFRGVAFRNELEDFPLARSELSERVRL